jgi:hypothetical protein
MMCDSSAMRSPMQSLNAASVSINPYIQTRGLGYTFRVEAAFLAKKYARGYAGIQRKTIYLGRVCNSF